MWNFLKSKCKIFEGPHAAHGLIPDLDKAVSNNKINNLSDLKYINI